MTNQIIIGARSVLKHIGASSNMNQRLSHFMPYIAERNQVIQRYISNLEIFAFLTAVAAVVVVFVVVVVVLTRSHMRRKYSNSVFPGTARQIKQPILSKIHPTPFTTGQREGIAGLIQTTCF